MTLAQLEILAKTWVIFLLVNVVLYSGVIAAPSNWEQVGWMGVSANGVILFGLICEFAPLLGGAIYFRRSAHG